MHGISANKNLVTPVSSCYCVLCKSNNVAFRNVLQRIKNGAFLLKSILLHLTNFLIITQPRKKNIKNFIFC